MGITRTIINHLNEDRQTNTFNIQFSLILSCVCLDFAESVAIAVHMVGIFTAGTQYVRIVFDHRRI